MLFATQIQCVLPDHVCCMDNHTSRSRLHVIMEELNRICEEDCTRPPGKNDARGLLMDELHRLGYRVLSVYSLEQEDLLLLPQALPEEVERIQTLEKECFSISLGQQEIFEMRAEIRQMEKDIALRFAMDEAMPWFRLISHASRLIVWNEAPGHPMNQLAEIYRDNTLLRTRNEYETFLWHYRFKHGASTDENVFSAFVSEYRQPPLLYTHIHLIRTCKKFDPDAGDIPTNSLIQRMNTCLLQAIELDNPATFREFGFWELIAVVKSEIAAHS